MTIRDYLIGMTASTVLCFVAWGVVVCNTDPGSSGFFVFLMFYLTLFLALASFFSLAGFYFRRKIFENIKEFRQIETAFRQGVFLAVIATGILLLQSQRLLNIYSAFMFVVLMVILEMRLSGRK